MFELLIGNFGKRNSVQNGQSQKAIQILRLLNEHMHVHPKQIDSGDYLAYAISFVQAIRQGQSIALCVGPKGIRLASMLFRLLEPTLRRKPAITLFVVGGWLPDLAGRARDVAELCRVSRVLVEAQGLRDELAANDISSELFPNFRMLPVLKRSRPYDANQIRLVYCGRISTAKGAERALEMLNALRKQKSRAQLDFFGPMEEPALVDLIDWTEGASYRGSFDDVSATAQIFPEYDFLVLPSAYPGECVPGAVVEAMFAGLPSVVSNWRFLPEIVQDRVTGIVCNLNDFTETASTRIAKITGAEHGRMSARCSNEANERYSSAYACERLLGSKRHV